MTPAQKSALLWLRNRNADGVFDKHQVLVAGGQKAPVKRTTWNRLEEAGAVEFYSNRRRLKVTEQGARVDMRGVSESQPDDSEDWGS